MAMMCKTGKGSLVIRGQINNNDLHAEIRDAVVLSGVTSVNGKTNIVVLTADDVEAISYSKQQNLTPEQQLLARTNSGAIDKGYVDSISSNLQTQIDNKVPTTRKVNNKALSEDIILTASDVNALPASTTYVKSINGQTGDVDARSDWNQNDETQPDYVKNRPFYTNDSVEMLMEETTVEFTKNDDMNLYESIGQYETSLMIGETYQVIWDGTTYEGICDEFTGEPICGNLSIQGLGEDTGEPFFYGMATFYTRDNSASHTISISRMTKVNIKIDEKYIPELQYMDKVNPTGTGSFSLNRKAGTEVGDRSFAEGLDTTASGSFSHAEGYGTIASSESCHAEGDSTIASGYISHTEGLYTTASGTFQHVQGKYNIEDSSNTYAHIVGNGTDEARSNAHTLDWSGNAWFVGDVYVGSTSGTNKDDGSKKLATEEYVDQNIPEKLSGSTDELTPTQVYDAVSAGRPVKVQYTDTTYGLLSFTNFNVAESLGVLVSQTIVYNNGVYILAELFGNVAVDANTWEFMITTLAQKTDIPTSLKNPNALTIKVGDTAVTYDGSESKSIEIADGKGGSGMDITGATVGQIAKISAVDGNGVPTAWEPVEPESWAFVMADGTTLTKKVYVNAGE